MTLRSEYERAKAIMASHGISYSEVSGGMFISRLSSGRSRKFSKPSEARSSGSIACH